MRCLSSKTLHVLRSYHLQPIVLSSNQAVLAKQLVHAVALFMLLLLLSVRPAGMQAAG